MKIEDLEGHTEDDVVPGKQQLVTMEAKRAVVLAGARILFYPTLIYNVFRNKLQSDFRWWDPVDQYLLLGAVPFPKDVPRLKQLGVGAVITLNEPYETLVPSSLYTANGIEHLLIPTRDYLFAPSFVDINRAVQFIRRNACCGRTTYVHCKAGRGRSTTIVLCYLVEHKNMAPADALEYVRSIRPRVALAPSQWKAVQEYSNRRLDASAQSPSVVLVTKADIQLDTSTHSPGDAVLMTNADLRMDTRVHSSFGDAVLITKADLQLDASAQSPSGDKIFRTNADLQMDAHSPSGDVVLITKADLQLDTSAHSPYGDAVLITNADLRMDTHSPSGEAVLITKADLEGYYSSCDDTGNGKQLAVLPGIKARPMMARLSCLFASVKISGVGGPATRQLSEARAC